MHAGKAVPADVLAAMKKRSQQYRVNEDKKYGGHDEANKAIRM